MRWDTCTYRGIEWDALEAVQGRAFDSVKQGALDGLLICSEPSATFTYGLSAKPTDLYWTDSESRGIAVRPVSRGGQWTFHGPGQIVIYPIVALERFGLSRRAAYHFARLMQESVLSYLSAVISDVEPGDRPLGIYSKGRKLVSFGFGIREGITMHGLALYFQPQNSYFQGITPCGVIGQPMVSLKELGWPKDWETTADELSQRIKTSFNQWKNRLG